ncbi:hypothetical protein QG37_02813 [Candidozyma auris]|uniref:Uncharacterized protein n=1 Tax=Candidozyma auris TaxID=498019 RepID=A0A0L0P1M9_CANAR|nr:hypothetical protein QG37_02813 [[Candida] auris]
MKQATEYKSTSAVAWSCRGKSLVCRGSDNFAANAQVIDHLHGHRRELERIYNVMKKSDGISKDLIFKFFFTTIVCLVWISLKRSYGFCEASAR